MAQNRRFNNVFNGCSIAGVSKDHSIKFFASTRDKVGDLQNMLKEVTTSYVPTTTTTTTANKMLGWMDTKGGTATQSNTCHGGVASRAIDGFWNKASWHQGSCTHTCQPNSWFKYTHTEDIHVEKIRLLNRGDCCEDRLRGAKIYVGGVQCATTDNSFGRGQKKDFVCKGTGKVIEIKFKGRYATICEFGIFGYPVSAQGLSCPWKTVIDEDKVMCDDGAIVSDWKCKAAGHGDRVKCPMNFPKMCMHKTCGGGQDFCCEVDCTSKGGERPCTVQQMQAPKPEVPLVNGGGSHCKNVAPCSKCHGDCDSDADCDTGLKCFQRSAKEKIPGCLSGGAGDDSGTDYCWDAADVPAGNDFPLQQLGGSFCKASRPCSKCYGDCDSDAECAAGLLCFERKDKMKIPGCASGGSHDQSGYDFCWDPKDAGKQIPLQQLGGSFCKASRPCSECRGDCDSDADCAAGLKCFQRNAKEVVPGCDSGTSHDQTSYDFCYNASKKASLQQVASEVIPASAAGSILTELPLGLPPPAIVKVTAEPPLVTGKFTAAIEVNAGQRSTPIDIGKASFNAKFSKCPVVKYTRDGDIHAVYVRGTAIPANFDAYTLFTQKWENPGSDRMGRDYNIYSSMDDIRWESKWTYFQKGHGFPGSSGKSGKTDNMWFRTLAYGGPKGVIAATLWIQEATNESACISQQGSDSVAPPPKKSASFDMSDSDAVITTKIKAAGLPEADVIVRSRQGVKWITMQNPTQSSTHHGRKASNAIDGASSCNYNSNTIIHTNKDRSPWWKADFDKIYDVVTVKVSARSDCCTHQLDNFEVYVDGTLCAKGVRISQGKTIDVSCVATGSSVMIVLPKHEYMTICEVKVGVLDADTSRTQLDKYALKVRHADSGAGPKLLFETSLAESKSTQVLSNGARFFDDVTDYWFRMPYKQNQAQLGPWREYIVSPREGTSPKVVSGNKAQLLQSSMELFQRSHTVHGKVSHQTRRQPERHWRLPARYHTEETLEALSRRVLGTAATPKTWPETSSLLEVHADRDQHALFKEGKIDPRDDKTALRWSSKASWGGQNPPTGASTDIIYFPEGKTGMLDMDINIRFWVLEGNLVWDAKDLNMGAEAVVVNGGQFLIGKENAPYTHKGLITLQGHWHTMKLPLCGAKTIFQTMGLIEMHGIPVTPTWTELEETAPAGQEWIKVRKAVNWGPGAHIVVAASDRVVKDCRLDRRDDCQVEERYVKQVNGLNITLDRPLVYRHLAEELEPHVSDKAHCARDPALCLKTQVRAEVGLLTRNIVVKGSNFDDGSGPAGSEGYGAHLMHAERAKYTYIEFHWMGQAFQMGRYPLHLHLTGLNPSSKILGCSLHRTFQRGITVHGTHSALIKDNVLYNHLSHGFFIEDGNEHNNVFENNLGMMTHPSYSMLVTDQTPATFWITNPQNYFRNNHAAGSHSFGFWFDTNGGQGGHTRRLLQKQFENNTAHSNGNTGVWVDIIDPRENCEASDTWTIGVPFRDDAGVSKPVHINQPECHGLRHRTEFKSVTTWGNQMHGMVFFEVGHLNILNHRSVSDGNGAIVWGLVTDTWPDSTNGWNGFVIRDSSYHTQSGLTGILPFATDCAIGTPWDDTLFITGTQFIGKFGKGSFCTCFFCLAKEGGYEIRTSDLRFHEGAGTAVSPRVSFIWLYSSFFFDLDGSLTGETDSCKLNGCYLHAPFDGTKSGMYKRRDTRTTTTTTVVAATTTLALPPGAGNPGTPPPGFGDGGDLNLNLIEGDSSVSGQQATSLSSRCLTSLIGRYGGSVLPDANITFSSVYRNKADHGKGQSFRSRIGYPHTSWCVNDNNNQQYIEWDFGIPKWITAIQTQGRANSDQWVTFYKLKCKATDSAPWADINGGSDYEGNRNRNTIVENRIDPIKCKSLRLYVDGWRSHISMRADVLGCSAATNLSQVCMDKPFLNTEQKDCRTLESELGAAGMKTFCTEKGHKASFTALSANLACCACGGGQTYFTQDPVKKQNQTLPVKPKVQIVKGGTGYAPPDLCRVEDASGGVVCERSSHLQHVTIKNAGLWHEMQTVDVQTEFGFARMEWAACYKQYEFSVFQNQRHLLVPPYTPKSLFDWDVFSATVKMRAGDQYVLQWETLHNPDGYTVAMPGQTKKAFANQAPVQYDTNFFNNKTLKDFLAKDRDVYSAKELDLSLALDLYKVADKPLFDTAHLPNSAANWGYLQGNASYKTQYWYPGAFQVLITANGVKFGSNALGPWNGKRKNILERVPTRPLQSHSGDAAKGETFSHIETELTWKRWDTVPAPPPGAAPTPAPDPKLFSRLEYMDKFCPFSVGSFAVSDEFSSPAAAEAKLADNADIKSKKVNASTAERFNWSAWPVKYGGKPAQNASYADMGVGNVTIEAHWEVTLDEDVDFINKLNISGVLKFADKAGCCKLVARYIVVGPYMGRLEAGTAASPFTFGRAHIILKGQPLTPQVSSWFPHLASSAKWLKNKFIAVQGTLNLYGAPRSRTWVKLAVSTAPGATVLKLDSGSDFKVGDRITIDEGLETKKVISVTPKADEITLDSPLKNGYKGLDHEYMKDPSTMGLMATAVGLIGGHTVIVEGEDTEGVPMCDVDENRTCKYSKGLPGGMSLHDFAKETRHYFKKTGKAMHPNCRPCRAVSDQAHSGYIIAMSYFPIGNCRCPKDHGVIHASNVEFSHASSIDLYHGYSGYGYPEDYEKGRDLKEEWAKYQFTWWKDPVWTELKVGFPASPTHLVEKCAFNNTFCGSAISLSVNTIGKVVDLAPVTGNVFLTGGVGVNGAARAGGQSATLPWALDKFGPNNDMTETSTMGVGSNIDEGNPLHMRKDRKSKEPFQLLDNFLSGASLTSLNGARVKNNVILGRVHLHGGPVASKDTAYFTDNVVSNNEPAGCVQMHTSGTNGISDNVVHSCPGAAVTFGSTGTYSGKLTRMKILDSAIGVDYFAKGGDGKIHDKRHDEFVVSDSQLYSKKDGSGVGIPNPKVHSGPLGEPMATDWWHVGGAFFPLGHSSISLYFRSKIDGVTFVGYDRSQGGSALATGSGHSGHFFTNSDEDFHPMMVNNLVFKGVSSDAKLHYSTSKGVGFGMKQCIQIDCDGLRNALVIDQDGSMLGSPGTIVPQPQKFYDKLTYVDPMGFDTMEDLIPMPARYDRFGDAIPFPSGVNHGTCGGLEYKCASVGGCPVLRQSSGNWIPSGLKIPEDGKIVATREDGGLVRLDPIFHGWQYAKGWVTTSECKITSDPKLCAKPESQHARRYGRVAAGQFGTHQNTSKIGATKGPVYTQPGIYRKGCTFNKAWNAYECKGGKHRHLVIEVMDWNHMTRRWAPVSVEVNDDYKPQGGYMNIMSGCAMYWTDQDTFRLQTFHALGHIGLRHNIYFSADPPQHLRLHLADASASEKVIASVYYGIPNNLVSYVKNQRKEAPLSMTPTWDNLKFFKLDTSMAHGTFYYDRIGVETGRPGYLYCVIGGDQYVDFKVSHKVVLTSKIKVDTSWGGWKGDKNNNFFKKGIDGLVRNIALLIGVPPTRIAILGNGTAKPGTFWNSKTTSTKFAEWMWKQNKSLDKQSQQNWKNMPGAKLPGSLMQMNIQSDSFLNTFAEDRREVVRKALDAGDQWHEHLLSLSKAERSAILERVQWNQLAMARESDEEKLLHLLEKQSETTEEEVIHSILPTLIIDDEPTEARDCGVEKAKDPGQKNKDCNALAAHEYNTDQVKLEVKDAMPIALKLKDNLTDLEVDDVPNKANPLGWTCATSRYGKDGKCDCGCGIWDPDCDDQTAHVHHTVAGFNNETGTIEVLDDMHVKAIMNWLDADGNGNGILDGTELTRLKSLGASALYTLATKIESMQDAGDDKGSADNHWMGNFANMLEAVETPDCNFIVKASSLQKLGPKVATLTPVCVKDPHWEILLGQPTGRCGVLPEMKIGSQCQVPGSGLPVMVSKKSGAEVVCDKIMQIFPSGGQGGITGAGLGISDADLFSPGGNFVPDAASGLGVMNNLDLVLPKGTFYDPDTSSKTGMTIYFKLHTYSWQCNSYLFYATDKAWLKNIGVNSCTASNKCNQCEGDCDSDKDCAAGLKCFQRSRHNPVPGCGGQGAWGWDYCYKPSETVKTWHDIFLHASACDTKKEEDDEMQMVLKIREQDTATRRRGWQEKSLMFNAKLNHPDAYMITVDNKKQKVAVTANGHELATTDFRFDDKTKPFKNIRLGNDYGWDGWGNDNGLDGKMSDIRIWNRAVDWSSAVAGTPPGEKPSSDGNEAQGTVTQKCISSKKNSWDFYCGDELPDYLSESFGYGTVREKRARQLWAERQKLGNVATCPHPRLTAKAIVFQGTFGDGLTGEYFQMTKDFNCGKFPRIFGKLPKHVSVDKTLNFAKFPYPVAGNRLVIRWTGKLLISVAGDYTFKVDVDDSAWVAIDGLLTVDQPNCHPNKGKHSADGRKHLGKGSHDISILYASYKDSTVGEFKIQYKGPDTDHLYKDIPASKLGSAPLRLAKLAKELESGANQSLAGAVIPGAFVWDNSAKLAKMEPGSCDIACRKGQLKNAGASFRFYCDSDTDVAFEAMVNADAQYASIWLDDKASYGWNMKSSFLQADGAVVTRSEAAPEDSPREEPTSLTEAVYEALDLSSDERAAPKMSVSPVTKKFAVEAGEHTVVFQGRPEGDKTFAFSQISMVAGADKCKFYLSGKDKTAQECDI
jgi:hypothetical protein